MTELREGDLAFSFPDGLHATRYDGWAFYRHRFQSVAGGSRAVDILCLTGETAWLLEIKDYRRHPRTKAVDISDEVSAKVRDTLAGLAAAAKGANETEEREFARRALARRRWRVAFHLEQPATRSRLRPRPFDPAAVLMTLRSKVKAVDAHPVVCSLDSGHAGSPWMARPFGAPSSGSD